MKRCDELRDLSDDHHDSLVLALRAKRAARGDPEHGVDDVWANLVRYYADELEEHFAIEESTLLPALERAGQVGLVERTLSEHRAIRAALSDERVRDASALETLARLLESHVRFEERVVYETAQAALAAGELEAVAVATNRRAASRGRAKGSPTVA